MYSEDNNNNNSDESDDLFDGNMEINDDQSKEDKRYSHQ